MSAWGHFGIQERHLVLTRRWSETNDVDCHERLGGLLKHCERKAAQADPRLSLALTARARFVIGGDSRLSRKKADKRAPVRAMPSCCRYSLFGWTTI